MTEISQEAVEIAAKALVLDSPRARGRTPGSLPRDWWEQLPYSVRKDNLRDASIALAAAQPAIQAQVLAGVREALLHQRCLDALALSIKEGVPYRQMIENLIVVSEAEIPNRLATLNPNEGEDDGES